MTEHDYEMASAYCDGELDSHERSMVEANPDLIALVDEIQVMRRVLKAEGGSPVPLQHRPSKALENAQLSAAGLKFDELFASIVDVREDEAATAAHEAAPVIDLRSRQKRNYRILSYAAGFLIVCGVGVMALRGSSGGSDDSSSDTASSDAESFDAASDEVTDGSSAEARTDEAAPAGADADGASDSAEMMVQDDVMEEAGEEESGYAADDEGSESPPVVLDPLFLFPEDTGLSTITEEILSDPDLQLADMPPYEACPSQLFASEQIELEIPILVGADLMDFAVVSEDGNRSSILTTLACEMQEQLPLGE